MFKEKEILKAEYDGVIEYVDAEKIIVHYDLTEDEKKKEIREKCRIFLRELKEYKEKSLYMSTDEFLWHLYMKSGYYAYVGALPSGSQRQANLKILFERAKQFEETSFKGIFTL